MAQGKVKVGGKQKVPAHQQRKQAPVKSKIDNFYKKKNVSVTKVLVVWSLHPCFLGNQQEHWGNHERKGRVVYFQAR